MTLNNRVFNQSKATSHIVFEKWIHPLSKISQKNNINNMDDEYPSYDDNDEDEHRGPPIFIDPIGISEFKFYIGYTDFKLSHKVQDIIDEVDGVESVEIWTPYRLRISVGKLFDDNSVISNVSKNIKKHLFSNE